MRGVQRTGIAIGLLLLVFQLERLVFFIANSEKFITCQPGHIAIAFLLGFRFDATAIMLINAPIIFCLLIPNLNILNEKNGSITRTLFLIINIPILLLNAIDIEYFKFQGKRTTADLFDLFTLGSDMRNTIPQMAVDFWQVILTFLVISCILIIATRKFLRDERPLNKTSFNEWMLFAASLPLLFLVARGSAGLKPLRIGNAASMTEPQLIPMVLNTPFTVIKTLGKPGLEEKNYFKTGAEIKYFNSTQTNDDAVEFQRKNIIIVILESFSAEYIGALNGGHGYTPFLDSLSREGLLFTNAFANAKKSIDGIPAVSASIPALMPVSFITSAYSANKVSSLPHILASEGYSSAFFHGGNNGTMGFDQFAKLAGYDRYIGRNEYGSQNYDGNWGVYDEPFLSFVSKTCETMKQPFITTVFTLSSHHPYSIPSSLKGRFPKGSLPIHESIGYADYSLKHFFDVASKTNWYQNSVFVITADHTGPSESDYYSSRTGMFRIPILYYDPSSKISRRSDRITQQTDIIPTILDYLHYKGTWRSFGSSSLDSSNIPIAVNYNDDLYQITGTNKVVQFNGTDVTAVFDHRKDPLLKNNLKANPDSESLLLINILKSVIQQYNHQLSHNSMTNESNP